MKASFCTLALLLGSLATNANAQEPITPPPGGIAIVSGGYYASGTIFANGMAYPAGTVVQASATELAPSVIYSSGYSNSYYPRYSNSYYPSTRYYGSTPLVAGVTFGLGYSNFGYGSNSYYGNGFNNSYYGNGFNNGYYGNGFNNGYYGNSYNRGGMYYGSTRGYGGGRRR